MEMNNVTALSNQTQANPKINRNDCTKTNLISKTECDSVEIKKNNSKNVNFNGNIEAVKGKTAVNVLKKVGSAVGIVGLALFSCLGALLPGDSENDKKIKTGINDKDTSEYCGTKSGDLYCFYSK